MASPPPPTGKRRRVSPDPPKPSKPPKAPAAPSPFDLPDFLSGVNVFLYDLSVTCVYLFVSDCHIAREHKDGQTVCRCVWCRYFQIRRGVNYPCHHRSELVCSRACGVLNSSLLRDDTFDDVETDYPKIRFVSPRWIKTCHDRQKMVDCTPFEIHKS